jgi:hypothetical protein
MRYGFDPVAPVLGNKAFNPLLIVAEKDYIFRTTHKQAVNS